MNSHVLILTAVTLVSITNCALGVSIDQLLSTATYSCIKQSGHDFVVLRGYLPIGAIDKTAAQGLLNAKNAGLSADIYMQPCRGKDAVAQARELIRGIPVHLYDKVWVHAVANPNHGCSWAGHDSASNCQFLFDILDEIDSHSKAVGAYSSISMWEQLFGGRIACAKVNDKLLFYAENDGIPSFSNFGWFGGWTSPNMKQYKANSTVCGLTTSESYEQ